ncbi:MAG: hypothetical protein KDM63_08220 [Verrucomicrobiae bacterium]|nr:hypothetical protein [Verrucomicrobiae bacterium]
MFSNLDESQLTALLDELCIRLGFCLPPNEGIRILESPPADIGEFAKMVFAAEGIPEAEVTRHLRREVEATIARHFEAAEDYEPGEPVGDGQIGVHLQPPRAPA